MVEKCVPEGSESWRPEYGLVNCLSQGGLPLWGVVAVDVEMTRYAGHGFLHFYPGWFSMSMDYDSLADFNCQTQFI